ncbi:hypothetical protein Tco_0291002 [Tanacetum coccineum]
MVILSLKHGLVSRTYSKKSLIMASIFGSKSKSFMTMSISPQGEPSIQSAGGKLHERNAKESWALLADLALYDNKSWNDPRDFAKPVKAISLPQDVLRTSDRLLVELKNQICNGPYDTQYCMENPEQAFIEYASSRTDEAGGSVSNFMASQDARLSMFEADFKQQQSDMTNKIDTVLKAITDRITGALPSDTFLESSGLVPQSSDIKIVCTKGDDVDVMFIEIIRKNDDSCEEGPKDEGSATIEGLELEYFDTFQTRSELAYHREDTNKGVSNFIGRIKGMHFFVGNFTYVLEFMIVEDISSIIDPRLSQVVLGKPFVEISNMTHNPPEGVVRFANRTDAIAYKMPHKIEQYNSLSDLEKVYTNSVNLRIEEDKRRGVEYVMSKILGFNRECLVLGPEYFTGVTDEDEVT